MTLVGKLEYNLSHVYTQAPTTSWVDISGYLRWKDGVTVSRGRADEASAVTPATLNLTLDNLDGRFTPGNAGSPLYPNITTPLWLRFTVTDQAALSSVRFTGLADSWVPEVAGPNSDKVVQVAATDVLKRIGRFRQLRSFLHEEILQDTPIAYYPLDDGSGAISFADQSGTLQPPLQVKNIGATGSFDAGGTTGPPGAGETAPNFDPDYSQDGNNPFGKYLQTNLTTPLVIGNGHAYTLEWWMKINDDGNSAESYAVPGFFRRYYGGMGMLDSSIPVNLFGGFYNGPFIINPAPSGGPYVQYGDARLVLQGGSIQSSTIPHAFGGHMTPGVWYHCALTSDGGTTNWSGLFYLNGHLMTYVDGGTLDPPSATVRNITYLALGGFPTLGGSLLSGSVAHAAVYQTCLTKARLMQHYLAGRNGFYGETLRNRLVRILKYAGLGDQSANAAIDTSETVVADQGADTALNLVHALETTEQGMFHVDAAGIPVFANRGHRYTSATLTLIATPGSGNVGPGDLQPILDDQRLVNDVTATTGNAASTRAVDAASVTTNGIYQQSVETVGASPTNADETSRWIINGRSNPLIRIPQITVDITARASIQTAVLAAKLQDQVAFTGLPTGYTIGAMAIEGMRETWSLEKQAITFTVTPNVPAAATYIVGTTGSDELDTSAARLGF